MYGNVNVLKGVLFLYYRCLNSVGFSGGECNRVRIVFSFIVNPPEFSSTYSFHVKIVPSCGLFGSCRQKCVV